MMILRPVVLVSTVAAVSHATSCIEPFVARQAFVPPPAWTCVADLVMTSRDSIKVRDFDNRGYQALLAEWPHPTAQDGKLWVVVQRRFRDNVASDTLVVTTSFPAGKRPPNDQVASVGTFAMRLFQQVEPQCDTRAQSEMKCELSGDQVPCA